MDIQARLGDMTARDWETTAAGRLRVAVVGLGWWTREHALPALAAAEHCTPTVAVSGDEQKRTAAAGEWNLATALSYREYADGVAADEYDAVYVCTPNATHLEHCETAARLGKAVLCEKPMEVNTDRAAALVAACADADIPLMVGYRLQTDPAVRRLRALVADGLVGTPLQFHGHMSQPLVEMLDGGGWRLDPDLAGPGATVTDLGVYPLNTARFLLGEDPTVVTATARSTDPAFEQVPDEHAAFSLQFPSGVTAQCSVSQNAQLTGHLRLVGTEGELALEPAYFGGDDQQLTVRRGETTVSTTWTPPDQMREEFAYFAQRVLADEDIEPDGEHGLVDAAAVEAIYKAARTGEAVAVDGPR